MKLHAAGHPEHVRIGLEEMWRDLSNLKVHNSAGFFWHHLRQAFRSVQTSPVTFLLTVITIAVALSILGSVVLILQNVRLSLAATQRDVGLSIFLKDEAAESQVITLRSEIQTRPGVASVLFRSKTDALREFRASLGEEGTMLEGLEEKNPLPASLEVRFQSGRREDFQSFANAYRGNDVVEQIQFNEGLLGQLGSLLETLRLAGFVVVGIVVLMTASIIGSAIKLALFARRDEVEIMHLVGANAAFIRAPYLVEGALQGIAGSLLALGFVYVLFAALLRAAERSTFFRLVGPELVFLSPGSSLLVVLVGIFVGLGGSYAALRKFRVD